MENEGNTVVKEMEEVKETNETTTNGKTSNLDNLPSIQKASMPVYRTRNYDLFSLIDENRNIDDLHVGGIKSSIDKFGYVEENVIIVTKDFYIMDGQHRFKALKDKNEPIYFAVHDISYQENQEYLTDLITDMNIKQSSWGFQDFVDRYASEGIRDYECYQEFADKYDFPISIPRYFLGITDDVIKDGSLEWPTDPDVVSVLHSMAEVVSAVRSVRSKNKMAHKKDFIRAVRMFIEEYREKIDMNDLISRVRKHAPEHSNHSASIQIRTNTEEYFFDLIEVWNYGRKSREKKITDIRLPSY